MGSLAMQVLGRATHSSKRSGVATAWAPHVALADFVVKYRVLPCCTSRLDAALCQDVCSSDAAASVPAGGGAVARACVLLRGAWLHSVQLSEHYRSRQLRRYDGPRLASHGPGSILHLQGEDRLPLGVAYGRARRGVPHVQAHRPLGGGRGK